MSLTIKDILNGASDPGQAVSDYVGNLQVGGQVQQAPMISSAPNNYNFNAGATNQYVPQNSLGLSSMGPAPMNANNPYSMAPATAPVQPAPVMAQPPINTGAQNQMTPAPMGQAMTTPVAPSAAPAPAPAPVATNNAPAPASAGPVAPTAPVTAEPVASTPTQNNVAPVNPAAPIATPVTAPQPAAQPPAPIPDAADHFVTNQTNPGVIANNAFNHPDPMVKAASAHETSDRLEEAKKTEEAERLTKENANNPDFFAKVLNAKNKDEGSYLKAYLYRRFGLNDLAADEQRKLGAGSKWVAGTDESGQRALIKVDGTGMPIAGYGAGGKALSANELPSYLSGAGKEAYAFSGTRMDVNDAKGNMIGKVAQVNNKTTGQQELRYVADTADGLHKAGEVYQGTHGVLAPERVAATNATTEFRENKSVESAAKKAEKTTEETSKRQVSGAQTRLNFAEPTAAASATGRVEGKFAAENAPAGGAVPTTAAPAAAPIGSELSPNLRNKIVSANRSTPEQQALYDETVKAGRPGVGPTGLPVAQPGTSQHELGNAFDMPKNLSRAERTELAMKGYHQPMGADSVHWERIPGFKQTAATQTTNPAEGPPPINPNLSRKQNDEIQKNWAAENKKILTDFSPGGTAGKQVIAITTATNHINDDFRPLIDKLANGQYPTANEMKNKISTWAGGSETNNFKFVAQAMADEIGKTLVTGGPGTQHEREQIEARFSAANNPKQLREAADYAERIMAGKTETLEEAYKRSGRNDFYKNVVTDPRVKTVVDRIRAERNVASGQAPNGTTKDGKKWKVVQ